MRWKNKSWSQKPRRRLLREKVENTERIQNRTHATLYRLSSPFPLQHRSLVDISRSGSRSRYGNYEGVKRG